MKGMDLLSWDLRYRARTEDDLAAAPTPLVVDTARRLKPGRCLDLACGVGRNALWLAEAGWQVTAVDGASAAIEVLNLRAAKAGLDIQTEVADLKAGYEIVPQFWDLITICYYLQRDLLKPAANGVTPGGLLLVIAHLVENGEQANENRLWPGELRRYFSGWEILHDFEGRPNDPAHKRFAAEIVVRRPR